MTSLAIVTGASRGLGLALARELLNRQWRVIGLARGAMGALSGAGFTACQADLADTATAIATLRQALAHSLQDTDSVCLINNAGSVAPVARSGEQDAGAIAAAIALNLTTPIALTNEFLHLTATSPARRTILNISSGAASTAYAGWSVYGATKAGLDQFSRCVAVEQQQSTNPAHIVSLAPGVIDTDMQAQLRATSSQDFPSRDRFVALKTEGHLQSAESTAKRMLDFLSHPEFGRDAVVDLRRI